MSGDLIPSSAVLGPPPGSPGAAGSSRSFVRVADQPDGTVRSALRHRTGRSSRSATVGHRSATLRPRCPHRLGLLGLPEAFNRFQQNTIRRRGAVVRVVRPAMLPTCRTSVLQESVTRRETRSARGLRRGRTGNHRRYAGERVGGERHILGSDRGGEVRGRRIEG